MRLHVVGLPHTETTRGYFTCAYTQKVVKFGKMMMDQGYEVILYSGEENEAECTEHVPVVTKAQQREWFGDDYADQKLLPVITWDPQSHFWLAMNNEVIKQITTRLASSEDIICLIGGKSQQPIADAFVNFQSVEFGIGYSGIFAKYKVFESYAWMHHVYGLNHNEIPNFYDVVIPNYFEPENFIEPDGTDDGYLLWMGRMIANKGPQVAADIAERTGLPLVMAGNGLLEQNGDEFIAAEVTVKSSNAIHVGPVGIEERAKLMSRARAVVMPTLYLEPFGGVAVEAMMSGTPVITPDWGAFVETNSPNFRFKTLRQACDAVDRAATVDRKVIRDYAISRYSLEPVGAQYDKYFRQLHDLWGDGWYTM